MPGIQRTQAMQRYKKYFQKAFFFGYKTKINAHCAMP